MAYETLYMSYTLSITLKGLIVLKVLIVHCQLLTINCSLRGVSMNFIRNLNLKDREIKLIYILIILLVVFIVFRLLNAFLPQTALAKQELEEMELEKKSIRLILYEVQELNAGNDLLELELRSLKDKFILESEDATYVMAQGYGDGILIKSIVPRGISDNSYYYTSAYSIDLEGTYQDIVNFISRLEQNPASKIVEINLNLNIVDMNVHGTIVWEIYSLYERRTSIVLASTYEYGRSDPFQVPKEYIGFLDDLIQDDTSDEIEKENQNLNEVIWENTAETKIVRENVIETIVAVDENILDDASREDSNIVRFLHENIYSFPIKQENSFH